MIIAFVLPNVVAYARTVCLLQLFLMPTVKCCQCKDFARRLDPPPKRTHAHIHSLTPVASSYKTLMRLSNVSDFEGVHCFFEGFSTLQAERLLPTCKAAPFGGAEFFNSTSNFGSRCCLTSKDIKLYSGHGYIKVSLR